MLLTASGVSKTNSLGLIEERKTRLDGTVRRWRCDLLELDPGRRAALRYDLRADRPVHGTDLVLRSGTITLAHFWIDRPYGVYHWIRDGKTVAYYANVGTVMAITRDVVSYLDLAVDVLIRPSGSLEILDEDELPDDLAPAHRRTISAALEVFITGARGVMQEMERERERLDILPA